MAANNDVPLNIGRRRTRGAKGVRRRAHFENRSQLIARANREEEFEESSGSESDEW